jgi:hypothetical protein
MLINSPRRIFDFPFTCCRSILLQCPAIVVLRSWGAGAEPTLRDLYD